MYTIVFITDIKNVIFFHLLIQHCHTFLWWLMNTSLKLNSDDTGHSWNNCYFPFSFRRPSFHIYVRTNPEWWHFRNCWNWNFTRQLPFLRSSNGIKTLQSSLKQAVSQDCSICTSKNVIEFLYDFHTGMHVASHNVGGKVGKARTNYWRRQLFVLLCIS